MSDERKEAILDGVEAHTPSKEATGAREQIEAAQVKKDTLQGQIRVLEPAWDMVRSRAASLGLTFGQQPERTPEQENTKGVGTPEKDVGTPEI